MVAGNFNLTNVDELFDVLVKLGQHPKQNPTPSRSSKNWSFPRRGNQRRFEALKAEGVDNQSISERIADTLDLGQVLRRASTDFDGGYVMCGMVGHGDAFVMRDPNGIRPAFWYERRSGGGCIGTSRDPNRLQRPGILHPRGRPRVQPWSSNATARRMWKRFGLRETARLASFERIYFSRGNDSDIYSERKALGKAIVPRVLEAVEHDLDHTVTKTSFPTPPNPRFRLVQGLEEHLNASKIARIKGLVSILTTQKSSHLERAAAGGQNSPSRTMLAPSSPKTALEMTWSPTSTTSPMGRWSAGWTHSVVIDDSIVRGNPEEEHLRILDRLGPKRIVVASSAPQIRYPDCYGIDMARMGDFIAFQGAVSLLKERGMDHVLTETYEACKHRSTLPLAENVNSQSDLRTFSDEEVSDRISPC